MNRQRAILAFLIAFVALSLIRSEVNAGQGATTYATIAGIPTFSRKDTS